MTMILFAFLNFAGWTILWLLFGGGEKIQILSNVWLIAFMILLKLDTRNGEDR